MLPFVHAYIPFKNVELSKRQLRLGKATLFVFLGQSNSSGRAPQDSSVSVWPDGAQHFDAGDQWSKLAPMDRLYHATDADKITDESYSFARSFAQAYALRHPREALYFVGAGDGGTDFISGDWIAGGASYLAAIARINAALAALPAGISPAVQFLWHQGNLDQLTEAGAAAYQSNLDSLIARLRADVTGATLQAPFVAGGQFVDGYFWNNADFRVQEATQSLPNRVAHTGYAHPGVPELFDNVHAGAEGTDAFGPRYLDGLIHARTNTNPAPSNTITAGAMQTFDLSTGAFMSASVDIGAEANDRLVLLGLALRGSGPHPTGVIFPERVMVAGVEAEHIVTPRRFSSSICATSIYLARVPAGTGVQNVTVQTNIATTMAAGVLLPVYGARAHLARVGGFAQLENDVVGAEDFSGTIHQEDGDLVFGVGAALFPGGGTDANLILDGAPQTTFRQVATGNVNFSAYGAMTLASADQNAAAVGLNFPDTASHPSATFCVIRPG